MFQKSTMLPLHLQKTHWKDLTLVQVRLAQISLILADLHTSEQVSMTMFIFLVTEIPKLVFIVILLLHSKS